MSTKILIVEDDTDINNILSKIMKKQEYETVQAFSGSEAQLRLFSTGEEFDLILLDMMLPGIMGEQLIQEIREKSEVPIIVISAKTALEDRVSAINKGADDYLIKPFEQEEVIARVNGALRRYKKYITKNHKQDGLSYKDLVIKTDSRMVYIGGNELMLTAHEYEILKLLVKNPDKVFSRESLYEEIWHGGYLGEDNTVNVHVSNLRKKISNFTSEEYIKTVWGIGFKMA